MPENNDSKRIVIVANSFGRALRPIPFLHRPRPRPPLADPTLEALSQPVGGLLLPESSIDLVELIPELFGEHRRASRIQRSTGQSGDIVWQAELDDLKNLSHHSSRTFKVGWKASQNTLSGIL